MLFLDIAPGSLVSFDGPPLGWPADSSAVVRWVDHTRGMVGISPCKDPRWTINLYLDEVTPWT